MEIDKIATLRLEPNDILVLNYNGKLNESAYAMLKEQLEVHFQNIKSVILENNMTLQVLKPALKWTSDLPTQEGLYQMKYVLSGKVKFEFVEIYEQEGLCIRFMGSSNDDVLSSMCKDNEWYGPIEPPEYKESP